MERYVPGKNFIVSAFNDSLLGIPGIALMFAGQETLVDDLYRGNTFALKLSEIFGGRAVGSLIGYFAAAEMFGIEALPYWASLTASRHVTFLLRVLAVGR